MRTRCDTNGDKIVLSPLGIAILARFDQNDPKLRQAFDPKIIAHIRANLADTVEDRKQSKVQTQQFWIRV